MKSDFRKLPLDERIQLVEDLWDSIAADQNALPLTPEQRAELDRRLDAYEADGDPVVRPKTLLRRSARSYEAQCPIGLYTLCALGDTRWEAYA